MEKIDKLRKEIRKMKGQDSAFEPCLNHILNLIDKIFGDVK